MSCLANESSPRSWSGNFLFTASQPKAQWTPWTENWHLKWGQPCETKLLTCGIWLYLKAGAELSSICRTSGHWSLRIREWLGGVGKYTSEWLTSTVSWLKVQKIDLDKVGQPPQAVEGLQNKSGVSLKARILSPDYSIKSCRSCQPALQVSPLLCDEIPY